VNKSDFELLVTSARQAGHIKRGEMESTFKLTHRAGLELIEVLKEKREDPADRGPARRRPEGAEFD